MIAQFCRLPSNCRGVADHGFQGFGKRWDYSNWGPWITAFGHNVSINLCLVPAAAKPVAGYEPNPISIVFPFNRRHCTQHFDNRSVDVGITRNDNP